MKYGSLEYQYAAPLAQALVDDPAFRKWVLLKSEFADYADARLLNSEMEAHRRSPNAEWWRFHFYSSCDCEGCTGGRETDILAVFEANNGSRFALHFEVKQPKDRFSPHSLQERRYPLRAACWVRKTPPKVLPHQAASTGVFFSEKSRSKFAPYIHNFRTQITFEEVENAFPPIAAWKKIYPA